MARLNGRPAEPSRSPANSAAKRLRQAERSAHFARREAAKVLRSVLQGDARRRATGSIKSLVYSPNVRNKKATFALVCQTLKYLPIIKNVLEEACVLNRKWKRREELIYVVVYDILFGEAKLSSGDAEKFLTLHKDALKSALEHLLVREGARNIDGLIDLHIKPDAAKPRYVRVNPLKLNTESAMLELRNIAAVQKDDLVQDLLILPPGTDLHDHPLVSNGSVFLQGKASSMVAAALDPNPGWEVLDACSAPGNKTVHLAALMKGKGRIFACELSKERINRLQDTIRLSGASNIQVLNGDFLSINPREHPFSKVRAILLDPSCSGSGTAAERLDHLLPSFTAGIYQYLTQDPDFISIFAIVSYPAPNAYNMLHTLVSRKLLMGNKTNNERLKKLAAFQRKALAHALSFPAVERVVYSTCSIHQAENEDVVESVLPLAASYGFHLAAPFPQWKRRGLPVFEGAELLLRTDPVVDKEGFFIALFVREKDSSAKANRKEEHSSRKQSELVRRKRFSSFACTRISKLCFYSKLKLSKEAVMARRTYQ